jgi:hypothetical protein
VSPVALAALLMAATGLSFLFMPQEAEAALVPGATGAKPLVQAFGAALLGFAAMNWTAKGSALGGIYGRAVVVANQTHLTIGAILLTTWGAGAGSVPAAYWVLTALYILGAAWFNWLTFFSSGIKR